MRRLVLAVAMLMSACASRQSTPRKTARPASLPSSSASTLPSTSTAPDDDTSVESVPDDAPTPAFPCAVRFRDVSPSWTGNELEVRLAPGDMLDAQQLGRLANGMPASIAVRIYAFGTPVALPFSLGARTCRFVYDLWNQVYFVSVDGKKSIVSLTTKHALRTCLSHLTVTNRTTMGTAPAVLAGIVDRDPPPSLFTDILKVAKAGYGPAPTTGSLGGTFQSLFCGTSTSLRFRAQLIAP